MKLGSRGFSAAFFVGSLVIFILLQCGFSPLISGNLSQWAKATLEKRKVFFEKIVEEPFWFVRELICCVSR